MRLHPESELRWGHMTLAHTLAHCTCGMQMATGVINPKRASFPASVIGPLIKPLVFGDDKPMRSNSPSSPELFSVHPTQCDFERERAQLITAIDRFVNKGQLAAPSTHIRSLVRSNRSSGPFPCTNTSTIIYDSSVSNSVPIVGCHPGIQEIELWRIGNPESAPDLGAPENMLKRRESSCVPESLCSAKGTDGPR